MAFIPLESTPSSGFVPLEEGKPKSGFVPLEGKVAVPNALGIGEGVLQFGTGMVAPIVGGLAGIGSAIGKAGGLTQSEPGDVVRSVSEALTYQPRTEGGQKTAGVLNYPFEKLQEGIHYVGNKGYETTESPLVGAGIETGLNAALLALPFLRGKKGAAPVESVPKEVVPEAAKPVEATIPKPQEIVNEYLLAKNESKILPEQAAPKPVVEEPPAPVRADVPKQEPLFEQQVSHETTGKVAALAKDFFEQNPHLRRKDYLISDDVRKYVWSGDIPTGALEKYGLSKQEFANELRLTVRDAAKTMQHYSDIARSFTPEDAAALKKAGFDVGEAAARPLWRRATDLWRASLVTQLSTAVRNAGAQTMRLGVDAMADAMDAGLQRSLGLPKKTNPLDGFEVVARVFQRNKEVATKILDRMPSERDRMLSSYLSDVEIPKGNMIGTATEKVLRGAEKTVNLLNIFNRTQEFIIRRAVFQARLSQDLRGKGLDLNEIIKSNQFDLIPDESIRTSVDKALHATFASEPTTEVGRALVTAVNKLPGASLVIPFPRFLANAIQFQYQHSPFGLLHYLSPTERAAFAAGETGRMSKAIIGSSLFGAAILFRNSEHAGERWYEARDSEGRVIDMRPYNPFAAYLFLADVAKRSSEGSLYKLRTQDVAQGVLSTQMRAGTGLYILDTTMQNFLGSGADSAKLEQRLKELSGTYAAGFLTPLAQIRDIYDEITQGFQTAKDIRQEPFLGPLKRQLPGVSQTLPDQTFPTRKGPMVNPRPSVKQFTGLLYSEPKRPIEKELDRLGFGYQEILAATGDRALDRQYREVMGKVMERVGSQIINSDGYKNANDRMKAVILAEVLSEVRKEVKQGVNKNLPLEKQFERAIKAQPPRLRLLLESIGVKP